MNENEKLKIEIDKSKYKIKTIIQIRKEIKAFFSLNGYSVILATNSVFKKTIWLIFMIMLVHLCAFYIDTSFKEYKNYDVVIQIKNRENETLTFPAITLCLVNFNYSIDLNRTPILTEHFATNFLEDIFLSCHFEDRECSVTDFEFFMLYYQHETIESYLNCYKFNGGKNSTNLKTDILQSTKFGAFSGLIMELSMLRRNFIFYYVGDNSVRPIYTELTRNIQPGKNVVVTIKKTIDAKLPEPYSRCTDKIDSGSSHLVKHILEQNVTYRKTNCYDLCLNEYASSRNISKKDVYAMRFNYPGNCSEICPVECFSNVFEVSEAVYNYDDHGSHFVWINFFYIDNQYIELNQTVKTTVADLVSKTGGLLGLFLKTNFMSAFRVFINFLDFLFAS